jgi:large subunit ribosomal protein L13e
LNVQRLKEYKERLVVFPRRNNKIKNGDATKAEIAESKLDTSSVNVVPAAAAAVTFAPITEVRLFEKYQYIKWYLITNSSSIWSDLVL